VSRCFSWLAFGNRFTRAAALLPGRLRQCDPDHAGDGICEHAPSEAYPAQLEVMLHAKGINATVVNAGINGDTTEGMLARLDSAVPKGTSVVILQPGGNDMRKGRPDQTAAIQGRLRTMGVRIVMCPNGMFRGLPHQPDGQHLTPEGYHMLAAKLVGQVAGALGR
jgi:acyl-CoA thioesterase-1